MENIAEHILLCSFFIVVVISLSFPASAQEVEDESDFDYNYNSKTGPRYWGEIRPEWTACKNGSMQSPIDMLNERVEVVAHLGDIRRRYKPSSAILKNRGHDMMMKWEGGAGYIIINGTRFYLRQCHWHSPSEHTINGMRFVLEAHLVHESLDGKIAVIGILYKYGRPDSYLSYLEKYLGGMNVTYKEQVVGVVHPSCIRIGSRKYYRYIGSLTVPPCTENVIWTLSQKIRTVTESQVKLLRVAVHDCSDTNARPVQPRNKRSVKLYRPSEEQTN